MIYRVAKVEEKKTLDTGAKVMHVGLVDPNGGKHWPIELYCHTPERIPGEGSEIEGEIVPAKFGDGKELKRAGRGGGRRPEDQIKVEDHRSQGIEAQVAFKGVIDLIVAGKADIGAGGELTKDFAKWIREAK